MNVDYFVGHDTVEAHRCIGVLVIEVLEQKLQLLD